MTRFFNMMAFLLLSVLNQARCVGLSDSTSEQVGKMNNIPDSTWEMQRFLSSHFQNAAVLRLL